MKKSDKIFSFFKFIYIWCN